MIGCDGPYVSLKNNFFHVLKVDEEGRFDRCIKEYSPSESFSLQCTVDNKDRDSFTVLLNGHDYLTPKKGYYDSPNKIIVISDIEGNFNALYSLLITHKVIDENFRWIFGENDLVMLGDLMDRGKNVTQCLWLIFHLEQQAEKHGGKVHFILGNHEIMNLQLQLRYVPEKYLMLAKRISGIEDPAAAYTCLLKNNTVLLNWIISKNSIEKIGDMLFVHGGISLPIIQLGLSIDMINGIVRNEIRGKKAKDQISRVLMGSLGPFWYRGFVTDHNEQNKITEEELIEILDFYQASKVVVGHTIVNKVSSDFHGKVVRVDVDHSEKKFSARSQALLIERDKVFRIDSAGGKVDITLDV